MNDSKKRIEYISRLRFNLEMEMSLLFSDIQSDLSELLMFDESIVINENSDHDSQHYITTIFGIAKDEIISAVGDVTHLTFDEIDKNDLTETMFDYITFQDKIYLLETIIDNLK